MTERMIPKSQVDELLNAMVPLLYFSRDGAIFENFSFPCGPHTRCTVQFSGPVDVDCFDSVLAHIAYYKTILPEPSARLVTKEDVTMLLERALDIRFQREDTPAQEKGTDDG